MCNLQNTFVCGHAVATLLNSFCTCSLTATSVQQTRCLLAACQPQTTNQSVPHAKHAPKQNSKKGNNNRR